MIGLWPAPLHGGATAAHHWGYQILAVAIVTGLWLVAAGLADRLAARRRQRTKSAEDLPPPVALTMHRARRRNDQDAARHVRPSASSLLTDRNGPDA
jgi:hypothetical protein